MTDASRPKTYSLRSLSQFNALALGGLDDVAARLHRRYRYISTISGT